MFRLYLEYARLVSPDRDNGKMVRPFLTFATDFCEQEGRLMGRTLSSRVNILLVRMRGLLREYMLRKGLFWMSPINRAE
jgi:hypothetical protein